MATSHRPIAPQSHPLFLSPQARAGLAELLRAHETVHRCGKDPWQFAVSLAELLATGLTRTDLRELVCTGYLHHALELTPPGSRKRKFQLTSDLCFSERSCFVLTEEGVRPASALWTMNLRADHEPSRSGGPHIRHAGRGSVPSWNADLGELNYRGQVVLRISRRAVTLWAILCAFHEQNWKRQIDDPLPPRSGIERKQRLHDTIVRMNESLKPGRIRFHGDGSGKGIRWEPVTE